eukprot:SAG31_NODE_651_length_13184_cov_4.999541_6_plen_484_part_00
MPQPSARTALLRAAVLLRAVRVASAGVQVVDIGPTSGYGWDDIAGPNTHVQSPPPPPPMRLPPFDGKFGHALLSEFMFDPNTTQFNHGSYGGTPAAVFEKQIQNIRYVEGFIIERIVGSWYRDGLLAVRKRIAAYIGAPWEDTVLVDNASNALNVLLNMWKFAANEVILDFSTAYSNFQNTYKWVYAARNVSTVTVPFTFPVSGPEIIVDALRTTLAYLKGNGTKVGVAIISQVSSWPAILLPVAELVAALKEEGIPSIVDGAHALGATPVNISALGSPEFWFGNGHKWLYTPKSSCALYVNRSFQTPTWPEPTVVDSFGDDFAARYVWSGTRDRSPFLAMGDAMDFREHLGEDALMAYIHKLSREGANLMVKLWGSENRGVGGLVAPHSMQATMHNVIAPTTGNMTIQKQQCSLISEQLVSRYKFQIYVGGVDEIACFLRVHAQIYLELSDYRRLAQAVMDILRDYNNKNKDNNKNNMYVRS